MSLNQIGIRLFPPTRNYSAHDIPSQSGKLAVITGGTSGIGLESALQLVKKGAEVIILGSSEEKGKRAVETIKQEAPQGKVEWVYLDLKSVKGSLASGERVKQAVRDFGEGRAIDLLMLNAGIATAFGVTEDGYEETFAVNHLGHFAFIQPLLTFFTGSTSRDSRIVITSSIVQSQAKSIPYATLTNKPPTVSKRFGDVFIESQKRYASSKLANVYFSRALQRRVGDGVFVNAVHPGAIATNIIDAFDGPAADSFKPLKTLILWVMSFFFTYVGISIADGALTQLYAATSPVIKTRGLKGQFFAPIGTVATTTEVADNVEAQEELWRWSEGAVAKAKSGEGQK